MSGRRASLAVLDIAAWRAATPKEMLAFLKRTRPAAPPPRGRTRSLVIRDRLRPVDLYAYLRVRFGRPNGFQNLLRKDDSDNLIHWDFNIRAGDEDVYFAGAAREVQVMLTEALTPNGWRDLIVGLQAEFARLGRDKSEMMRTFEKYVVFHNKFAALADICADLHAKIVDAPAYKPFELKVPRRNSKAPAPPRQDVSERAAELYAACAQLSLLTPVMAEAYLNMLILILCRPELREDEAAYRAFIRETIPDRIGRLHEVCLGMRPVNRRSPLYGRFMTVINKRNFAIHGDVDPIRDAMETVYFEGKRPLFVETGHHIARFFEGLERLHRPDVVVADYEDVHAFLHELSEHIESPYRRLFDGVIDDLFPGYEVRRKAVTRLFPDHLVMGQMGGMRYDDQLKVVWP